MSKRYIDLRSDTVTMPTKEMYEAMVSAEVGDDVAQDDPTAAKLEALAAELLGKEAALYTVSGTMGNLVGVLTHISRGDEVILGQNTHVYNKEVGGLAALGGAVARALPYPGDMPDVDMIAAAIRTEDIHHAPTRLICLENALCNGRVVPPARMAEIYALAQSRGIAVHVDGARIMNAAVALGVDVKELTRHCDTINCCLSKGLCSPIGAVLAGPRDYIRRARKVRKMVGGGMRQCGVTAATGIVSLTKMVDRLAEDHANARYLAARLNAMEGITVDEAAVEINMVFARIQKPAGWRASLPELMLEKGVKIYGEFPDGFRFVTHNDVSREDIDAFLGALQEAMAS